jgi:hypothetical protein
VQPGFVLAAKVKMAKGGCDLSRRVVASSGQLRPATAYCGLLQLAVASYGWLQVAMVGQRLAMAGRAWQRLAKMCLLLSNTARVSEESIRQDGGVFLLV